jgi:hypothetical protein
LIGSAGAAEPPKKDLAEAVSKAARMKSYSFHVEEGKGAARARVQGQYQAGQPLALGADGVSFYRKGDALAYLDGGIWHRSRTGTLSDPLRILGPSAKVRRVVPPHEELARLPKEVAKVERAAGKEKGTVVYTCLLTKDGAKAWAPTESRAVAQEGTVRVWVKDGVVVKYDVTLRLRGRLGDAEVKGTSTRTVEVRDVGKTKVDPPPLARKALGP